MLLLMLQAGGSFAAAKNAFALAHCSPSHRICSFHVASKNRILILYSPVHAAQEGKEENAPRGRTCCLLEWTVLVLR